MKNIIQKSFIALALMGTMSCGDDFFDKTPQDSLDPSKIDERLFIGLRNGIYRHLNDGYGGIFEDGYADNGYSRNLWDSNGSSVQGNTLTSSQAYVLVTKLLNKSITFNRFQPIYVRSIKLKLA